MIGVVIAVMLAAVSPTAGSSGVEPGAEPGAAAAAVPPSLINIDGVAYERAAKGELCLRQADVKGIAFLNDDTLILRAKDGYYMNETQGLCRPKDVVEATIKLVSKGPRVCRNDRVRVKDYGRMGPPRECVLGEFFALSPAAR